jgi:hypothetical protein
MRVNCILIVVGGLVGEEEEVSVLSCRGDRMESGGEIGERSPVLNIPPWLSRPSAKRPSEVPKRKQALCQKRKSGAFTEGAAGGCLVHEGKTSQSGRLKEHEAIEFSITRLRLDERIR